MAEEDLELKIIQAMQAGMPLVAEPYRQVAEQMGISEQELIAQLEQMQKQGVIRRIGAVPNHYALGYLYNLMTVWDIEDHAISQVGKMVGALDFVSHCYRRPRHLPDWPYNFFAMVHGRSEAEAKAKMQQIESLVKPWCAQFSALKSSRILKKTGLRV